MAVISARVDDQLKLDAERIADSIGLPLSSVVNVFLRRFIAEQGFPFDVVVPPVKNRSPVFDKSALLKSVREAVADENNTAPSESFVYLDPNTQELITKHV